VLNKKTGDLGEPPGEEFRSVPLAIVLLSQKANLCYQNPKRQDFQTPADFGCCGGIGEGITPFAIGSWTKPQPAGETQDGSPGERNHITDMLSLNQKPDLPGECSGDHRIDRGSSVWTCEVFDA
jgi:hypothetical protein